jgi:hypothetical protein
MIAADPQLAEVRARIASFGFAPGSLALLTLDKAGGRGIIGAFQQRSVS